MRRSGLLCVLGLIAGGLAAPAAFGARKAPQPTVDPALATLPFGSSAHRTFTWISENLVKGTLISLRRTESAPVGPAEARRLVAQMEKSVVSFDGTDSGYEASIVNEEFAHHNRESMFAYTDARTTHYFFFHADRLYKYACQLDVKRTTFVDRVRLLALQLGPPAATYEGSDAEAGIGEARWESAEVLARIVSRRDTHGRDLLVIEDRGLSAIVDQGRRGFKPGDGYQISPELKQFLQVSQAD